MSRILSIIASIDWSPWGVVLVVCAPGLLLFCLGAWPCRDGEIELDRLCATQCLACQPKNAQAACVAECRHLGDQCVPSGPFIVRSAVGAAVLCPEAPR